MGIHHAATGALALLLCACAGSGDGLDQNGRPESGTSDPLGPQLESLQAQVFTPMCTTCHSGAAAPLGLRLDGPATYAMLVNAPSVEVPQRMRVVPGDPDASYLIQKLEGTAAVGGRMPLNAPAVPAETIAVIRQWITDGAAESSGAAAALSASMNLPASLQAVWPLADAEFDESSAALVVSSNVELDTTLLSAGTLTLRRSGGDGDFSNGNEDVVEATISVRSLQPTVLALTPLASGWIADRYELRASGSDPLALADLGGHPIDGDGDGISGGDFLVRFTVREQK